MAAHRFQGEHKNAKITPQVHGEMLRVKAELEQAKGRAVTVSETIEELIRYWDKTDELIRDIRAAAAPQ